MTTGHDDLTRLMEQVQGDNDAVAALLDNILQQESARMAEFYAQMQQRDDEINALLDDLLRREHEYFAPLYEQLRRQSDELDKLLDDIRAADDTLGYFGMVTDERGDTMTAPKRKKPTTTGKPVRSSGLPAKTAKLPHVTLSAEAHRRLALIDYNRQLTWVLRDAIAYIGSHRKTDVIPRRASCPVSLIAANRLIKLGFGMWLDDQKTIVMLTFQGERAYAAIKGLPEPT